jgi:hypothetical protein
MGKQTGAYEAVFIVGSKSGTVSPLGVITVLTQKK